MNFTRIALQKITELVTRQEFVSIVYIGDDRVTVALKFRVCTVSPEGDMEWADLKEI